MLHYLTRYFRPSPETHHAYTLYAAINAEARQERFFTEWGVPDTLDGRFEMILLHMFLYLHTMKQMGEGTTTLQRKLIEAFFEDMDRSVRELGVGDTGVSRRIKKMANAFYGRINAFETALGDDALLAESLRKNTFATAEHIPDDLRFACEYMREKLDTLQEVDVTSLAYLEERAS